MKRKNCLRIVAYIYLLLGVVVFGLFLAQIILRLKFIKQDLKDYKYPITLRGFLRTYNDFTSYYKHHFET